jgi:hypothetical protein
MCFFNLAGFGTNWAFLHCKKPKLQEIFLSKTNSILTGKQCARCYFSNIDGFLLRDTCVSSTQLNRPICNKRGYLHLENPKLQKVFL